MKTTFSRTWGIFRTIIVLSIILQGIIGGSSSAQAAQTPNQATAIQLENGQGFVTITAGNCPNSNVAQYTITQNGNVLAEGTMIGTPPSTTIELLILHGDKATVEIQCGPLPAHAQINCSVDQNPGIAFQGFDPAERQIVCNALKAIARQVGGEANFMNLAYDAARIVCANHPADPEACPASGESYHVTYEKWSGDPSHSPNHWEGNDDQIGRPSRPFIELHIFGPDVDGTGGGTPYYQDTSRSYLPDEWRNLGDYQSTTVMHETTHMLQMVRPDIQSAFEAIYNADQDSFLYPSGTSSTDCRPVSKPGYEVEAQTMALVMQYGLQNNLVVTDLNTEQLDTIATFLTGDQPACGHRVRLALIEKVQEVIRSLQPAVFDVHIQQNGCLGPINNPESISFDCEVFGARVDTVIVMDTTGSMGSSIQGLKNSMVSFINGLVKAGADYRVAVVDYKDAEYDSYGAKLDLDFSTSQNEIVNIINALSASGGGDIPEDVYSGLITAIKLRWRDGAKKVIILIGDAGPHDPEAQTGYTANLVIDSANKVDPANIYAIRVGSNSAMRSAFQQLADGTGGLVFDASASSGSVSTALLNAVNAITSFPSAVIGTLNEPISGTTGTLMNFDGSHSFDPNGFIARYEWDFNDDGVFDINTAAPWVDYTYPGDYSGWVVLRVTDNDGNQASVKVWASISGVPTNINDLLTAQDKACVHGWITSQGVCNSLKAKLQAAKSAIERGNSRTAKNQLEAFIAELEAQKGKKVTQEGYDALKDGAVSVIAHLP